MKDLEQVEKKFPINQPVTYQAIIGVTKKIPCKIMSKPWKLGSGHIVIKVEGQRGGVSVDHLEIAE